MHVRRHVVLITEVYQARSAELDMVATVSLHAKHRQQLMVLIYFKADLPESGGVLIDYHPITEIIISLATGSVGMF